MLRCLTPHCSSLPPTQRHQMDREAVVFLIDASPAMLQRAPGVTTNAVNTGDGESSKSQVQIKTYLDVAIAQRLLRHVAARCADPRICALQYIPESRSLPRSTRPKRRTSAWLPPPPDAAAPRAAAAKAAASPAPGLAATGQAGGMSRSRPRERRPGRRARMAGSPAPIRCRFTTSAFGRATRAAARRQGWRKSGLSGAAGRKWSPGWRG